MTIHLPKELESSINAAVLSGHFASADDLVTEIVRDHFERKQQQALQQRPAAGQEKPATAPKTILEMVDELRKSVPPEEFLKLPRDGAEQLDHYLYGSPKRPTS